MLETIYHFFNYISTVNQNLDVGPNSNARSWYSSRKQTCTHLNFNLTDECTVFRILDQLKFSSSGPDIFPAWFLRLAAPFISKSLTHVYNLSIRSGLVPNQWKHSIITPVAKVRDPVNPQDYRPISVTSILSRKMEHLIVTKFLYPSMLNPTPQLDFNDQYAFRPTGLLPQHWSQLSTVWRNYIRLEGLRSCWRLTLARLSTVFDIKHFWKSMRCWIWKTVYTTGSFRTLRTEAT